MNVAETREKIMSSDEFVIDEARKLQILYQLKREIRYGHERTTELHTESVAEHIYALHCLTDYFLPLENTNNTYNKYRVHQMIQYHDIGEIETGDIVAYKKTKEDYEEEVFAAKRVIAQLPETMQTETIAWLDEFEDQKTIEAKFARAVDKFEPWIHCFNETGKQTLLQNKFTLKMRLDYLDNSLEEFPIMKRFETVLDTLFIREGYFYSK